MKQLIKWFFGFREKYRKQEEEYHSETKKNGTSGKLLMLILFSCLPCLCLYGAFKSQELPLLLLCIAGTTSIFIVPKECLILGIIALRHRARMKVQNFVEDVAITTTVELATGQELAEEQKQEIKAKKAKGTAYGYDLAVGILGILLAILQVVAFVVLFFWLLGLL